MRWRQWRVTWHRVCHHEAIWIQLVYCAMSTTDTWLQAKLSSSSVITSVGPLSPLLKNAFWGTNFFNSSNPSAMRDSSFPLNIMKPRGRPPAGDAHISLNSWWLAWSRDPVASMKTCDKWWGTNDVAQQLLTFTTTVTTVNAVTTVTTTRRYGPLRGPTSGSCRGLQPAAEAFFALWAQQKPYYAVLDNFWQFLVFSSSLGNF